MEAVERRNYLGGKLVDGAKALYEFFERLRYDDEISSNELQDEL